VSIFSIDFIGFDGAILCARIEIKINGIFYPLTAANITPLASSPTCVTGSFTYFTLTADGYITVSTIGGAGLIGRGRITITNVNATSVTVSTNDGVGTAFSNPFNCTTVPLKLESFNGQSNNCKVLLNWKTGIEFNVKNIEVQRCEDGSVFNKVVELSPKGSDSEYSFITSNISDAFFRLKITDFDGYYEYSNILNIKSNCNKTTYQVIPNPTSSSMEITGLKDDDRVFVLDMLGRKVLTLNSSNNNNKFDIQKLMQGMYILQIINNNMIKYNIKIIKK
jgi:hypothetical protein